MTKFMQRRGNTEAFDQLHELGDTYTAALAAVREVSTTINREVETALASGVSLDKLSEVSGLSIAQLEYISVSVDIQHGLDNDVRRPNLRAAG
jgi:hypothetical protein